MSNEEEAYSKLRRAVLHESPDTVRRCLLRGVNPNVDDRDSSILHEAIQVMPEYCVQKIDLLVNQGKFDVNRRDSCGRTPLLCACASDRNTDGVVIAQLLKLRADPNISSHIGASPLGKAAQRKAAAVVSLLLESGAYVNPPILFNRHGIITDGIHVDESPLCEAAKRYDDDETIAKILIDRGARVNIPNCPHGSILEQTPLYNAIFFKNVRIARCLLENGADPNVPCNLLFIASLKKSPGLTMVKLLVEYGADVFAEDSAGRSIVENLSVRANADVSFYNEDKNRRRRERLLAVAQFLSEEMLRQRQERQLAVVMGAHGRLGENSGLGRSLSRDMIDKIARVMM